jgi:hypothetical protein
MNFTLVASKRKDICTHHCNMCYTIRIFGRYIIAGRCAGTAATAATFYQNPCTIHRFYVNRFTFRPAIKMFPLKIRMNLFVFIFRKNSRICSFTCCVHSHFWRDMDSHWLMLGGFVGVFHQTCNDITLRHCDIVLSCVKWHLQFLK